MESFNLYGTLKAPKKKSNVPEFAKWLAGEGAGSWFYIEYMDENYCITRFSPEGKIECKGIFVTKNHFDIEQEFEITYLSHCLEVNVLQHKKKVKFSLQHELE